MSKNQAVFLLGSVHVYWHKKEPIQAKSGRLMTSHLNSARTVEENTKFWTGKKFSCKAKPIFDFIPMDHVIVFLETTGATLRSHSEDFRWFVKIDLLIRELRRSDQAVFLNTLLETLEYITRFLLF